MPVNREEPQGERLQKILAHAGVASRRKCEELIVAGRVKVNGKVITELGTRVDAQEDLIEVDGAPIIAHNPQLSYYLLYKPGGYLSTVSDPHGRPTALSLVPTDERLYPVGRLDMNSEGLLLFTNDGELAHRLMHPRFEHEKEYLVLVEGKPTDHDLEHLSAGVHLEDGVTFVHAEASRLKSDFRWRKDPNPPGTVWLRIVLREGRKRQIRLMIQALGYTVVRLIRVRMGKLVLGPLEPGAGRWLGKAEIFELRQSAQLDHIRKPAIRRPTRGTRVEKDDHRHRRPGGLRQEHRRRPAGR